MANYFIVEYANDIIYVNSNCTVKLIHEYVRAKIGIPDNMEMDLCDEDGVLKCTYESAEGLNGKELFENKKTYYAVMFRRDEYGQLSDPRPRISPTHPNYAKLTKKLSKHCQRFSGESILSIESFVSGKKRSKRSKQKKSPVMR